MNSALLDKFPFIDLKVEELNKSQMKFRDSYLSIDGKCADTIDYEDSEELEQEM